jgi:hypothetical protein
MRYDIDLLSNKDGFAASYFDFKESGERVSSRAKVVKRFIQLLYTVQGSDKTDPDAGCLLLDKIAGINMEIPAIEIYVQEAVNTCSEQLRNDQPDDILPEEKLINVQLANISADLDKVDIILNFTFADAASASVPVTFDYDNA